jgi:hypothetical protein
MNRESVSIVTSCAATATTRRVARSRLSIAQLTLKKYRGIERRDKYLYSRHKHTHPRLFFDFIITCQVHRKKQRCSSEITGRSMAPQTFMYVYVPTAILSFTVISDTQTRTNSSREARWRGTWQPQLPSESKPPRGGDSWHRSAESSSGQSQSRPRGYQ